MDERAYLRYQQLNDRIESDGEYRFLQAQRLNQMTAFMAVLERMPTAEQEIVLEYLGICGEIGERRVEVACLLP